MAQGKLIEPADLVLEHAKPASESPSLREARTRTEHQSVLEALVKHRGNISRAAKEPGVSRPTFYELLEKHNLNAREFRQSRTFTAWAIRDPQ